jgi:hypothetical protein
MLLTGNAQLMSPNHTFSHYHSSVLKTLALGAASLLVLNGCSTLNVDTAKLSQQEVRATVEEGKAAQAREVEPLAGPLTLDGAIARAIKYNAERRYKPM